MRSVLSLAPKASWLRRSRDSLDLRNSSGYAVAEFAVVLPALIFITFIGMWCINVGIHQLHIQSISAAVARTASRGDSINAQVSAARSEGIHIEMVRDATTITVSAAQEVEISFPGMHTGIHLSSSSSELIESDAVDGSTVS